MFLTRRRNGEPLILSSRFRTGRSSPSPRSWDPRLTSRPARSSTSTDRAKCNLRGIDEQIAKAEKAVKGRAAIKRNRYVQLTGGTKTINRDLETKTRALAGLKGYVTNLAAPSPEYLLGAYHQLWQIEKSFRMSKSDLRARPIYHHKRESIEAHLTIVMAALAVGRFVEQATDGSIARFVKTPRPCRTITIQAGDQIITASDPIPGDTLDALTRLHAEPTH